MFTCGERELFEIFLCFYVKKCEYYVVIEVEWEWNEGEGRERDRERKRERERDRRNVRLNQ